VNTSTIRSRTLALLLLLLTVFAYGGEIEPKDEKGFTPERAYHLGDIDSVNLYNGNLTIMLPIGSPYPVGGHLSYGLTLSYNSTVWKREDWNVTTPVPPHKCASRRPSPETNAGFGWNLSPTQLQIPCGKNAVCSDPVTTSETFVSSDGARHVFYPKLHDGDPTSSAVGYTRDGTYARAKADGNGHLIEMGDGTQQRYEEIPNTNVVHITDMLDGLGNWVSFSYPSGNELDISDSQNRTQIIRYTTYSSSDEPNLQTVPSEVELTASGGKKLLYTFGYVLTSIPRTDIYPSNDYCDSDYVTVPLLKTLTVKEKGSTATLQTWSFSYYGETADGSEKSLSGALKSMTLPTGGTYSYEYAHFDLPASACDESSTNPRVLRVTGKTITPSTAGASINSPMTWRYSAALRPQTQTTTLLCGIGNSWVDVPPEEEMTVTVDSPSKLRVVNYFSVWNQIFPSIDGNQKIENGLPLTRRVQYETSGEFLSTQEFDCSSCLDFTSQGVLKRSTYVRYERDQRVSTVGGYYALNKRVAAQRTVFHDDPANCTTSCRYNRSVSDNFDGLGHYRSATQSSTIPGSASRTSFTNYNATSSTYALDSTGNLIGSYSMPSETAPWILNIYDQQWEEENSAAAKRTFDFDSQTGLLRSIRIFKDNKSSHTLLQTDSHDVYRTYCYSAGNLTSERHYGGDRATLPTSLPAACTGTAPVPANGEYQIDHGYSGGVRATSHYANSSLYQLDRTIDVPSALPTTVRDIAGVTTTFQYDVLGRLTWTKRRDGSNTQMVYAGPDATYTKPTLFINERAHGDGNESNLLTPVAQSKFEYDGIGRLWHESQLMPGGSWSTRETTYDNHGLKTSVSEMGNPTANLTTFTYDWLGRTTKVHAPDGAETTTQYTGGSKVTSSVDVATSRSGSTFGNTTSTTSQDLDSQGRVVAVTESNGVKTSYGYDLGGHLASVCMNDSGSGCGQVRSFSYDNRGFLVSESHPENGITSYLQTDSRGHVWRKLNGNANGTFDIDMLYDSLERLTTVQQHGSSPRPLKSFEFADTATDDAKGKLARAVRHNWFTFGPIPPASTPTTVNYQIAETYTYGGPDGRVSARTTSEYDCIVSPTDDCKTLRTGTANRSFNQTFAYDGSGRVTTLGYPTCTQTGCSGAIAARSLTNDYEQGRLKTVTFPYGAASKVNTLTYLPNGMVGTVHHSNEVEDSVQSYYGMMRPQKLTTTGAMDGAACVAPAISTQPSPATIQSGGSAVLSAVVTADANTTAHPLTYQWYVGVTGNTGVPVSNSNTPNLTVQPSSTTSYWMRASNNCGTNGSTVSADTVTATVTVCSPPTITSQPAGTSITRGYQPAYLSVGATGGSLSFQWYEGTSGDMTRPVSGAIGSNLFISPSNTTTYWVAVTSGCGSSINSNAATVTVYAPPTAPSNLSATLVNGAIVLSWSAATPAAGFGSYQVQRAVDSPAWSTAATGLSSATWTQSSPSSGKAYVFEARVIDSNGAPSAWSSPDVATNIVFADDPLSSGTIIRAVHVQELRTAIDAVRRTAGLPAQWSTYTPTGFVLAQHMTEMRQALYEARLHLGLLPVTYIYDPITAGVVIHAQDVIDLRNGVK